mmetsp:Transcript_96304/g.249079  ORF Transcript_96304/g.249079 Transcript_96304/m.249079 type:complete len:241 (-) Transcript_96304:1872-2594(-)
MLPLVVVLLLLLILEVLVLVLAHALLALRALHLLLVDLEQHAQERRVVPDELRELVLQVLLLAVPLLDLHLLLTQLVLALLDVVHDLGFVLAALRRLLEQGLVFLLELVQRQQLLVEDQELHVRILQVALQLRLLLLNGRDRIVEGVDDLLDVVLQLALVVPEASLRLLGDRLAKDAGAVAPVLQQLRSEREALDTARSQGRAPGDRRAGGLLLLSERGAAGLLRAICLVVARGLVVRRL